MYEGRFRRYQYEDYIQQIKSIPAQPSPEVLGLNMNAGITRDLDISKTFFDSLALMQVSHVVSARFWQCTKRAYRAASRASIYFGVPDTF